MPCLLPRAALSLLLLCLCLAACQSVSPQSTLEAYAEAVKDQDAERAYALLSPAAQEEIDFKDFEASFERQYRTGQKSSAEALREIATQPAFVDALLAYNEFETLQMSLTPDGWRIEEGVSNFYAQRTPREALHSFLQAVERKRYAVIPRFLSAQVAEHSDAASLQAQLESDPIVMLEILVRLRQNLDNEIRTESNEATLHYGEGKAVSFRREDGLWKILDLD